MSDSPFDDMETALQSISAIIMDDDRCIVQFRHIHDYKWYEKTVCVHQYGWKPYTEVEYAALAVVLFSCPDFFTRGESNE